MKFFFRIFSHLPLWLLHGLGAWIGVLSVALSPTYRRRALHNAKLAGYGWTIAWQGAIQAGKMVAELPRLWLGRPVRVQWHDEPALQALLDDNVALSKGIIILAPHIGCWEVVGQSIADAGFAKGLRMTVMYRPARQPWLDEMVRTNRARPSMQTVPADLGGVRQLLRVLKAGQIIGVLPDQVPPDGMGMWSEVFGQPAYTMTMAAKMAQATGATAVLCWCERLSLGRGYRMYTQVWPLDTQADLPSVVRQINVGVETAIRALPQQYLWGYARYKAPRGGQGG